MGSQEEEFFVCKYIYCVSIREKGNLEYIGRVGHVMLMLWLAVYANGGILKSGCQSRYTETEIGTCWYAIKLCPILGIYNSHCDMSGLVPKQVN